MIKKVSIISFVIFISFTFQNGTLAASTSYEQKIERLPDNELVEKKRKARKKATDFSAAFEAWVKQVLERSDQVDCIYYSAVARHRALYGDHSCAAIYAKFFEDIEKDKKNKAKVTTIEREIQKRIAYYESIIARTSLSFC